MHAIATAVYAKRPLREGPLSGLACHAVRPFPSYGECQGTAIQPKPASGNRIAEPFAQLGQPILIELGPGWFRR